jgi:hypothetical protein
VLFSYTIPNGGWDDPIQGWVPWEGWTAVIDFDLTAPYPDPTSGSWEWPPAGSHQLRSWKPVHTPQVDFAPSRPNYVFASNIGQSDGRNRIFVFSLSGSYRKQISSDAGVSFPVYSPDNRWVYYTQSLPGGGSRIRRVLLGAGAPAATVLTDAAQVDVQPVSGTTLAGEQL